LIGLPAFRITFEDGKQNVIGTDGHFTKCKHINNGLNSIVKYIIVSQLTKDSPISGLSLLDGDKRSIITIGDAELFIDINCEQNVKGGFYFFELKQNEGLVDIRLCGQ